MPRASVVREGIEFKEQNGPDSVNYFKPWYDTKLVVSQN